MKKQKKQMSKKRKYIKIFLRAFLWSAIFAILILGLYTADIIVKNVIEKAPEITRDSVIPSGYKSVVLDCQGNKTADLIAEGSNRIWVDIDQIPSCVKEAFIAIEDERFYKHNGIDIRGIVRAGIRGVQNGFHFSEGASTITQQLIKNNVFDFMSETTMKERIKRKLQEQYLAVKLERDIMTKDEILEAYLNTINLGQNSLGVQVAAQRYFGKEVSELSISEAAVLAGIAKNPTAYNPINYPDNNKERQKLVLDKMLEQGYISEQEYTTALADDVYTRIQNIEEHMEPQIVYSYYVDAVIEEVIKDLQKSRGYTYKQAYHLLYYGGLTIESAQDPAIQVIMDEEMKKKENYPDTAKVGLDYALTVTKPDGEQKHYSKENLLVYREETTGIASLLFETKEEAEACMEQYRFSVTEEGDAIYEKIDFTVQPQASMVVMEQTTGLVKGIVGGLGEKEKSLVLNRATDTVRQPGSTFKTVAVYAPALDVGGMTLASTQYDAPYTYWNGEAVKNWDRETYQGFSTLRKGIEQSMNIVAVKTLTELTPELSYQYLLQFGFTSLVGEMDKNGNSDIVQPIALGGLTNGVSNLELTASYAAIANGGVYTEPIFYTRVLDHKGNVLLEKQPETKRVIKETTAWLLTSAMEDVVKKGTGTAAYFEHMAIAGKTGTTSKYNDVWFMGYTPYYTAGIWAGYDNNNKLERGERSFHKTIWKQVMARIHEELPYKEFVKPEDIVSAKICTKSGRLPVPEVCDACIQTEYFARGTIPSKYCDIHISELVCAESGQLATSQCGMVEMRTIELIPLDTQDSTSSLGGRRLTYPTCSLHPEVMTTQIAPTEPTE